MRGPVNFIAKVSLSLTLPIFNDWDQSVISLWTARRLGCETTPGISIRAPSERLLRRLAAVPAVAFERVEIAADFRRCAAEVEIVLIEPGDLLQPLDSEQS
jgi:hypothetical protein